MNHHMTRLEKAALVSAASGAVFNVFLYGIGATLAKAGQGTDLYLWRVAAAILQAAAFDLVAVATVMGRQHGRWSNWSKLTAIVAACVSAFIALDVAGVWSQPWLHAANALIVLAFTLHLLTPPSLTADERARLAALDREATELRQDLIETEKLLTAERRNVAGLRRELAARPEPLTEEVVYLVKHRLTWPQVEQLAHALRQLDNVNQSTIRRRVAALAGPMTEGE